MDPNLQLYRASILHFPTSTVSPELEFCYFSDGYMVTRNDKIEGLGDFIHLPSEYRELKCVDYTGMLLLPGLIDSHVHFPQTEMIASFGEQLLEWLQNYTFPTEQKFEDEQYAANISKIFLNQLLSNGTTSALVYSTVHKAATDALFDQARNINMCLAAGKVCMDRNCPPELRDTVQSAQVDSAALIEKWHGNGRLLYALTPRFAPTSSPEQLSALGDLAKQYPDVFIQTHLSENKNEIAWVKSLYPEFTHYLDVYDYFGLVRNRSVFGHCLHLLPYEWELLKSAGATVAFCPSSNLFLGSGLFDIEEARQHKVNIALASDVGAGTTFNMLRVQGEAYKVSQLNHSKLSPLEGLYMMTQGAAVALGLDSSIGNLNVGTDADFILLDPKFNQLSQLRTANVYAGDQIDQPSDLIFALSMLADERTIHATYVAGERVYQNTQGERR